MQLLSLVPILILFLYLLVSIDLSYTGICLLGLDLSQKENNCSQRMIQTVVLLKLQVVSALQIIVSVSDGI